MSKLTKSEGIIYGLCCDIINIIEGQYDYDTKREAYDNAYKITNKLNRKERSNGKKI